MLFNTVFKMTKVGNSPYVRRQLIPEFTAIVRKTLSRGIWPLEQKNNHFYWTGCCESEHCLMTQHVPTCNLGPAHVWFFKNDTVFFGQYALNIFYL